MRIELLNNVHFPLQQSAREPTSTRMVYVEVALTIWIAAQFELLTICSSSSDSFDQLTHPTRAS
jgi:hypothetical protein